MTCYRIYLVCPMNARANTNILNQKCITVLVRQNGGGLVEMRETNGSTVSVVDICDTDASSLLWNLPYPFTVLFVVIRKSSEVLFAHRVFKWNIICRSRMLSDKGVYWAAKSLENHLGNVKIDRDDYLQAVQPNDTT